MYYGGKTFFLDNSSFAYDLNAKAPAEGFDPEHMDFSQINIRIESFGYGENDLHGDFKAFHAVERSGFEIESLTGTIESDQTLIKTSDLLLKTPYSDIRFMVNLPLSAIKKNPSGTIQAMLTASVGREDVLFFWGAANEEFRTEYPQDDIELVAGVEGNFDALRLRELHLSLQNAFDLEASGEIYALNNAVTRAGEVTMTLETYDLDFVLAMLPESQRERFKLPQMQLNAEAHLNNGTYQADLLLQQGLCKIELQGEIDPKAQTYEAALKVDSLNLTKFMPGDSLMQLAAAFRASGSGFDPFGAETRLKLDADINNIRYGFATLADIRLNASLEKNQAQLNFASSYPPALLDFVLKASLYKDSVTAKLDMNVGRLDFRALHLFSDSLATTFKLNATAMSNLKTDNELNLSLTDWKVATNTGVYPFLPLNLHLKSFSDTTDIRFSTGDLNMLLLGNQDIQAMLAKINVINTKIKTQVANNENVNIEALKSDLPDLHFLLTAGKDNAAYNIAKFYKMTFDSLAVDFDMTPEAGIFMDMDAFGFMRDTMRIDSICFMMHQDTAGLIYDIHVIKHKYRQQAPFSAEVKGNLRSNFADAEFIYKNALGKTGFLIGARIDIEKEGYRLHLFPDNPIIAYKPYQLNPDNYVFYKDIKDISANLKLEGEEGAELWIRSGQENEAEEELHVDISHISLAALSAAFPDMPKLRGMVSANLQYAPSDSSFTMMADVYIDTLYYNNGRVGELMFNATYLPISKKEHQVDLHLFRDNQEITTITAYYQMGNNDYLDGTLSINNLPFDMLNPFIPDDMARIDGDLIGNMNITGSTKHPVLNGFIELDSTDIYMAMVGSTFKLQDDKIDVKDNLISFKDFNIYSAGNNPFTINGDINIHDIRKIHADITLSAENMVLLNSKKTKESIAYGKLIVDLNSTIRGPIDALQMRGGLKLLGGTDITYVMQESPLTAQDKLTGLVTFTNFSDTLLLQQQEALQAQLPIGGLDLVLTIDIDQSVRVNADLSPDGSNRIELEGGGDLSFQYTPQGEMYLNGRYTLSGGMVKYTIPIIPLKEFNIQNGSYVQWNGNVLNPVLNLTATERVRASVSQDNGSSRMVVFNVGVSITQTLETMQLRFVITAPEDQVMQQELNRLGEEQQAQIAVTMLITGMYINMNSAGSTQGPNFNMGSALNAVLQSEINNLAGAAFQNMDITVGMEQSSALDNNRSDLSFSISKRFYNDRISIILGGTIAGKNNNNEGQSQPFINNISVEYRLDGSGTR